MRLLSTPFHPLQTSPAETAAFSAKERDVETGLSVTSLRSVSSLPLGNLRTSSHCTRWLRRFGARYYSSDLSIWLSVDPMVDKYPSSSPYVYCTNNPLRYVDPDGEAFVISTSEDESGNKIVNIKFSAVLVDETKTSILTDDGLSEEQMSSYKDQIAKAITQTWNTTTDDGTKINVDVDLTINPKGSIEYLVGSRHRIYLGEHCDEGHVAEAAIGGTFMRLSSTLINGEEPNSIERTVAHEFGHLLGLEHNDVDMKNVMNPGGSWANIEGSQINEILGNYPNNMFSRGNKNFFTMSVGH